MTEDTVMTNEYDENQMSIFSREEHMRQNPYLYKDIEFYIARTLQRIGIRPNLKGYRYLKEAVKISIEKKDEIEFITKQLYPSVASKFNTTPTRVERTIRTAIHDVMRSGCIDRDLSTFFSSDRHYTNKEFISKVAEYVSLICDLRDYLIGDKK